MFKQQHILKSRLIVTDWLTLGLLCLALMLLTACRSVSSTIKVDGEVMPEPVVGEIVTLRIEAVSQRNGGEGHIWVTPFDNINIINSDLEWHGSVTAGEPFMHEITFCITYPSTTGFYMVAGVEGTDPGETQVHIISDADSAQVLTGSEYTGSWTPPPHRTPTAVPEPITLSPECAGEE